MNEKRPICMREQEKERGRGGGGERERERENTKESVRKGGRAK